MDQAKQLNMVELLVEKNIASGGGAEPAIYFEDKVITYSEVEKEVNKCGQALKELAVDYEDRVIILLPDIPEAIYSYLGAMKIGAVPVPINTMAMPSEIEYMVNDSRAKVLVVSDDLLPKVEEVESGLNLLKAVVVIRYLSDAPQIKLGKVPRYGYSQLVERQSSELETDLTHRDDMSYWQYSGGTTGRPKAIVHLHHDHTISSRVFAEEVLNVSKEDITLSVGKFFFSYGLNNSLYVPFLYGASTLLYPEKPDPEVCLELITSKKVTIFFGVATWYRNALKLIKENPDKYDLSSLRICISAAEPVPPAIYDQWLETTGLEIIEGLGSTDVGYIYISNKEGCVKKGSCGKLLSGYEAKIVDDNMKEVEVGSVGELIIKSDSTAAYYWHHHEKTKKAFYGEWLLTDDMCHQDEEGYLYWDGRADDMLKSGGIWVSPVEIEQAMMLHQAVKECAVVGEEDSDGLSKPKAFVVLNQGFSPSSKLSEELKLFLRERLSVYKCPKWFEFVEELPKTFKGTLQRFKLRK